MKGGKLHLEQNFDAYAQCLKITENVSFKFSETCHLTIFGIFNELLSTQKVNLDSLALLNETFSMIFKHCGFYFCILRFQTTAKSGVAQGRSLIARLQQRYCC